jgi:hypothetical protein
MNYFPVYGSKWHVQNIVTFSILQFGIFEQYARMKGYE